MSMKRIRITQPGWETYNGPLNEVEFVDGLSTDIVPRRIVDRLSGLVMVEEVDDEGNATGQVGAQVRLIDESQERAPVVTPMMRASDEKPEEPKQPEAPVVTPPKFHTREELEAIASEKGIKGLREIADPLEVRGKAILELIVEILSAETKLKARADALGETPEPAAETPAEDETPADDAAKQD